MYMDMKTDFTSYTNPESRGIPSSLDNPVQQAEPSLEN